MTSRRPSRRTSPNERPDVLDLLAIDDENVADGVEPLRRIEDASAREAAAWDVTSVRRDRLRSRSRARHRSPFRRFRELGPPASEQIEHRHPDGDAVRHLIEDHAVRTIGHVGVDLDAAIHRAWVHDEDVARRAVEPLARDAEHAVVFAQRRDVARRACARAAAAAR